jgi:hypothetical protein
MASFVSAAQSIPNATATKIVDQADFDRMVTINASSSVHVAFTSGTASTGAFAAKLAMSTSIDTAQFVLPADEELWVHQSSGNPITISFLVTAIAR